MKAKFKVLDNKYSLRDCTIGKVYDGLVDEDGRFFVFIDDVGDRVNAEIDNRLEKVEENTMSNEFTKSMLKAGKHVVEYRGSGLRLVLETNKGLGLSGLDGVRDDLSVYRDNLKHSTYSYSDIVKVYTLRSSELLKNLFDSDNLELVWERKEKSQQEIEYEKLLEQISELQKQAEKLKP